MDSIGVKVRVAVEVLFGHRRSGREPGPSHPHPKPSVESLLHDGQNDSDSSDEPDRQISRQARRRAVSQAHRAQKKSQQGDTSQSELELSPAQDFSSSDESRVQQKRHTVTHPPVINRTMQDRNTLGSGNHQTQSATRL